MPDFYLGNRGDEDAESLAQGGGDDVVAADFATNGRWRTKGFVDSFEEVEENNCLLFSWTFKFCSNATNSTNKHNND